MTAKEFVFVTEVKNDYIRIPRTFIDQTREVDKWLCIEVVTPQGSCYITPIDFPEKLQLSTLSGTQDLYLETKFQLMDSSLNKLETEFLKKFHYSWFNLLRDLLNDDLLKILKKIKDRRNTDAIFPSQKDLFYPFSFDLEDVNSIILGEYPLSSMGLGVSAEKYRKIFGDMIEKGVLCLSLSLSEDETPFDSSFHKETWLPFTKEVVKRLHEKYPIAFLNKEDHQEFNLDKTIELQTTIDEFNDILNFLKL